MHNEDIIEGPIDVEKPGPFIINLVITDKKGTDRIRVTLDCQAVNKEIYPTREPIPNKNFDMIWVAVTSFQFLI